MKHACLHEEDLTGLRADVERIKGLLSNGLTSRVKNIERLQYWQMGAIVLIIGVVLFGLWYFTTRTLDANAALMRKLDDHATKTEHVGRASTK